MPLLHQLFQDAEKRFGNRTAVVFEDQHITYSELNRRAEQLSQAILQKAKDEEIICLSTARSLEMVIGLLAILKAGKSYLPLDASFPVSRLEQILISSKVRICVASSP
ncbi:MAG TPA: AMP-binding protein, partial [Aequorivita sp.]|nr:AMP-binding protein [Aequorivita sp.]